MRKATIAIVGGAVLVLLAAGPSSAGPGPRLAGKFNVIGTIRSDDFVPPIPPGTKAVDTYTFKPTCRKGGCAKVKLTRFAGGRKIKSVLHRVGPRRYKGTEGPAAYVCVDPIGTPATFTSTDVIRITKVRKGRATAIKGRLQIRFQGCTETFENGTVLGTR
jgi:hypothetical protein